MISHDDLEAARANLARAQERFNCRPDCLVRVNGHQVMGAPSSPNILDCMLPDDLLREVLDRKIHWNNLEISCLIRFNRVGPYMPDVHTLMSYFHLPREAT